MLDSVLEFITQAASSSTFIFCFCNLIIVIILVDLKPSLSIHQESEIPPSKGDENEKQKAKYSNSLVEKETASLPQAVEVSHDQEAETVESIGIEGNDYCNNEDEEKVEEEDDDDDNNDDDDDDDNDEDELKRRVEEFIEKVNKGWKEELLSTCIGLK